MSANNTFFDLVHSMVAPVYKPPVHVDVNNNPNSNANLSALGMVETLGINIAFFIIFMAVFESNRFYKQIYLKRLQNRFQVWFATQQIFSFFCYNMFDFYRH